MNVNNYIIDHLLNMLIEVRQICKETVEIIDNYFYCNLDYELMDIEMTIIDRKKLYDSWVSEFYDN